MKTQLSNNLKGAKNIGATIEKCLNEIGVFSLADLAQMTPVKAYQNICRQNPGKTFPVCYYLDDYPLETLMPVFMSGGHILKPNYYSLLTKALLFQN